MSAYRYNVNIDRGVITRKWNDGQTETFKLDDLPENVIRYAAILGLKERLGSGGIFAAKGDWKPKALRDLAAKEYAELCNGNIPSQRQPTSIPTLEQLVDAFAIIAPDAKRGDLQIKALSIHPDGADDDKSAQKRKRELKQYMEDERLANALREVGFEPPKSGKSIDSLLG